VIEVQIMRRSSIYLLVSVVFTLIFSPAASGTNNNGWRTGTNSTISFGQCNLTSLFHTAAHDVDVQVESTQVTTTLLHSCDDGETRVFDFAYDSAFFGKWECHQFAGNICVMGHVHIDLVDPPGGSYSDVEAQSLMCEEIGHSVSLAHSSENGSCMSQQWDEQNLSTHDKGVINSVY